MLCVGLGLAMPVQAATLLIMGDSLSAAYGMRREEGWVALLERKMAQSQPGWTVVNASISGETTQGGLTRLGAELARAKPAVVVIELGANDGLRGLPVTAMRDNLITMTREAQKIGARVLIVGMRLPPNYGPAYTTPFQAVFAESAKATGAALVPFLLEGVALQPALIQADGLHPNAAAQPALLETVWKYLRPLLRRQGS